MSSFTTVRQTLTTWVFFYAVVLCVSFVSHGECQTTAPPPPPVPCSAYKTCDTCVPHAKCLWCFTTNNCTDYPVPWVLPPASLCQLSQARWGMCWLNFEALIITMAVLCGTILISISVCCCCCCCCKKRQSGCRDNESNIHHAQQNFNHCNLPDRDEERFARKREEIKQRAEERKGERRARHDEIRRKYGLIGDADHPYSKFENE